MTLQEALATGKNIRLAAISDEYMSYEDLVGYFLVDRSAALATTWEVEPDSGLNVSEDLVAVAWNNARGTSLSVKPAGASDFYKRFLAELKDLAS